MQCILFKFRFHIAQKSNTELERGEMAISGEERKKCLTGSGEGEERPSSNRLRSDQPQTDPDRA